MLYLREPTENSNNIQILSRQSFYIKYLEPVVLFVGGFNSDDLGYVVKSCKKLFQWIFCST